ncbi:MAG: cyclodeaminase/cyclohydrolase family protein [Clostridiales Family XIII bacterium]|jgi:formiminotetrahydrofolate cyclodeaminase|nr:cyclodeaminase/cyclohydrolase family protein [Clostridiales Family XIII bacterium]
MEFIDKSCGEFISELAGKSPVPGGGGASALVGAVGMALGNMVAELTLGKKKYADVENDIARLNEAAHELRERLLSLVSRDAEVFEPLAEAYRLPSDTDENRTRKEAVMEEALKVACSAPLEIMAVCCEAIKLHDELSVKGSRMAISDAGVGVALCKAALKGASLNVFINTGAMKDRGYAEGINKEADEMLAEFEPLADGIYARVSDILRG